VDSNRFAVHGVPFHWIYVVTDSLEFSS
jgi:hypothetical protein